MSRGPGRWQRAILNVIEDGSPCYVTTPFLTTAEQVAARRAAYTLEAAGKIKLTSQRSEVDGTKRLVAYAPDWPMPEPRIVTGLDGKEYRQPS